MNRIYYLALAGILFGGPMFLGGCGAQRSAPTIGFGTVDIQAQLKREDLIIMDAVDGQSTQTTILCGLINIIDGDKLQLLGIKFFEDRYCGLDASMTDNRAYYKALEKQAEADAIFQKSWDRTESGIPLLWQTASSTVRGKAIKLKADK
jgi:hypothetical protein